MASTVSLEGIKKAVFFPFQGRSWPSKLLIGIVLGLAGFLVVPALFINGYSARIMQNIIRADEDPSLPEWTDWGGLLLDGVKLFGVVVLYQLPALLLIVGGYFLSLALSLGFSLAVVPLASSDPNNIPAWPFIGSMFGSFAGIFIAVFGFMLVFVSLIFVPPAVGNMIAKGEFNAAFRVREWWPVFKANLSGYFLAVVIALGLMSVLYFVLMAFYMTVVLCALLPLVIGVTAFVVGMVTYALFAVAYRDGLRKLAVEA